MQVSPFQKETLRIVNHTNQQKTFLIIKAKTVNF